MMVLDNSKCKKCNTVCNAIRFQQGFENWTSGSDYINKCIKNIQLSAHYDAKGALEWIPYSRLYNIKYTKDKFSEVYRARWIDGHIDEWDNSNKNWRRKGHDMFVILKSLNNSDENITSEFINKV
jgi:hypothetical protein